MRPCCSAARRYRPGWRSSRGCSHRFGGTRSGHRSGRSAAPLMSSRSTPGRNSIFTAAFHRFRWQSSRAHDRPWCTGTDRPASGPCSGCCRVRGGRGRRRHRRSVRRCRRIGCADRLRVAAPAAIRVQCLAPVVHGHIRCERSQHPGPGAAIEGELNTDEIVPQSVETDTAHLARQTRVHRGRRCAKPAAVRKSEPCRRSQRRRPWAYSSCSH